MITSLRYLLGFILALISMVLMVIAIIVLGLPYLILELFVRLILKSAAWCLDTELDEVLNE